MAEYITTDTDLTSVANAIRTKGGTNAALSFPSEFVTAIENLSSGTGAVVVEETQDTNGGTIKNIVGIDISDTTAAAADVASGKYFYTANGTKTAGTATIGGATDGDVIFIDYDGSIVDAKTKSEINAMTSDSDLPSNPSHTGLTAQGWNWTVAQLKAQLTAMPDQKVYVGQMYVTQSGATEIDVTMQESRLTPILTISVNGTVSVDWGDNTTPDTVTGTSLTTRLEAGPHSYANAGKYTIKISATSGSYTFYCSTGYTILRKNTTQVENRNYTNCVKAVRLGNNISSIGDYTFYNCMSLSSITIPNSVTAFSSNVFNCCYSLKSVTLPSDVTSFESGFFTSCCSLVRVSIPSGITSIPVSAFSSCNAISDVTIPSGVTDINASCFSTCISLSNISIPSGITSISNSTFNQCSSMSNVVIPSGVTSIGTTSFNNCFGISSITVPSGVTSIGNSAFAGCYGVKEYHMKPTSVPTGGTTMFNNIVSDCVIYVPQGKLNDYQTASNWSAYASYMQEEPSV